MYKDFEKDHGRFAEAARLIDQNLNTEATIFIAKQFGLDSYVEVFESIDVICNFDGEMHEDLISVRRRWVKNMRRWVHFNASRQDIAHLTGLL